MLRLAMCVGLGLAVVQAAACGDDEGCKTNSDCKPGQICRIGLCALDPNQADGTSTSNDGAELPPLECRAATAADLVLNELLADPPSGADIDGNGTPSTTEDEFVEVVNVSTEAVALTGVEIDVNGKRTPIGQLCLNPNTARVYFGSMGLSGLTNDHGTVSLVVNGTVAQSVTYGSEASHDASITLLPQLDKNGTWVRSDTQWGPKYTPGTCSDNAEFPNCGTNPVVEQDVETVDGTNETVTPTCETAPIAGDLVINEIMADPGPAVGGNDSNGDGIVDSGDDEFVEIVNVSASTLLLANVKVVDASGDAFTFPSTTCVAPNQAIVIFGKYAGTGSFEGVLTFDKLGFAVNNTNETISILAPDASVLATVSTGSLGGNDQSITRAIDLDPTSSFVNHSAAPNAGGRKMSPGFCQTGAAFPDCGAPVVEEGPLSDAEVIDDTTVAETTTPEETTTVTETVEDTSPACGPLATSADLVINEALLDPPEAFDANGDGTASTTQDEFVEIINIGAAAVRMDTLQVWDSAAAKYTVPANVCLQPFEALVVFGKGTKYFGAAGVTSVDTTGHSLDLNNTGDTVSIKSGADVLATQVFATASDQSFTRSPDATGAFALHKTVNAALPASPGQCTNGNALPACLTP